MLEKEHDTFAESCLVKWKVQLYFIFFCTHKVVSKATDLRNSCETDTSNQDASRERSGDGTSPFQNPDSRTRGLKLEDVF